MINFSDLTIIECLGNYNLIKETFLKEGLTKWMLISEAAVVTSDISSLFLLHFWQDGRVFLKETNRPVSESAPSTDLTELRKWCEDGGWKLYVDDRLLTSLSEYQFWMQKYREGLVLSDTLTQDEQKDSERMADVIIIEQKQEEEEI